MNWLKVLKRQVVSQKVMLGLFERNELAFYLNLSPELLLENLFC